MKKIQCTRFSRQKFQFYAAQNTVKLKFMTRKRITLNFFNVEFGTQNRPPAGIRRLRLDAERITERNCPDEQNKFFEALFVTPSRAPANLIFVGGPVRARRAQRLGGESTEKVAF